jgi:hypothetical protein
VTALRRTLPWPWIGVVPVAWVGHVLVGSILVETRCEQGLLAGDLLGTPASRVLMLALTVAALAIDAVVVARLLACARGPERDERHPQLCLAGLLLACAFAVYLLWSIGPTFAAATCPG